MQLNPDAFNAFLNNIGQSYTWRRSFACPCVNLVSGAANTSCPQCGGRGRLWKAGVPGVAGMCGGKQQRTWAQSGVFETGDVVVTIGSDSAMYGMGQYDRVIALNNSDVFSTTLVRGSPAERLAFAIESIERVFWLDSTGAMVEGGLPTVASDGTLTWSAGAPPAGKQYSITGSRLTEFFCFGEYPGDRNEHQGVALPRRVVLRSFDLYSRSGKN